MSQATAAVKADEDGGVFLSRDDFDSGDVWRTRSIKVGEKDGKPIYLKLRECTAEEFLSFSDEEREYQALAKEVEEKKGTPEHAKFAREALGKNFTRLAGIVIRLAINPQGKPMFSPGDEPKIIAKFGPTVILDCYKTVMEGLQADAAIVPGE